MSILRALLVAACSLSFGCGGDETSLFILEAFVSSGPGGALAPIGLGPEGRLLLASTSAPGRLAALDRRSGTAVDAPFDAFPTPHAPVALDRRLFLVTPVGRVAAYELDGTGAGLFPDEGLGRTTAPVIAPGPSLRLATTAGRLLGLDGAGATVLDTPLGGAAVGLLVDGARSVVTTDGGAVVFVAADASVALQDALSPPLAAPVRMGTQIGVVSGDGLQLFDADGNRGPLAPTGGAIAAVGGDTVFLLWSPDGRLRGIDGSGAEVFSTAVPGLSRAGPVALSGDRFALVADDGVARALDARGAVVAERAEVRLPTGPLTVDPDTDRVYYPSQADAVGLDFAVPL